MGFNSNTPRQEFVATASQTDFVFNFKIYADTDLKVYQTADGVDPDDTTDILTLTTHYTVVLDGDDGGTVTLVSGATLDDKVTILRDLPYTRTTDYQTGGDLLAATLDADQEYQTYLSQQLDAEKGQFLKLPDSVQNADGTLPAPAGDAYFKWNSAGTAIENDTTIPDAVTTSAANAAAAAASATQAELYEWEAEAERLTADSYATEAEDTFVNNVTSDGDGTFTYTPTTDYSALHHSAKSATWNPANYAALAGATFTGQAKGITPVSAEDLTRKDYVDLKAPLASPTLTGTPLAPTATAGTNTTQIATTANVYGTSLGWGQTWQDVSASRALDTTYTNTTGKPIQVFVNRRVHSSSTPYTASFLVDGLNSGILGTGGTPSIDLYNATTFTIPDDSTYRAEGTGSITEWLELR